MAIKILVVSDIEKLREAVVSALHIQMPNCTVLESKNPIDALIKAQENNISLIYCGAILTGFSGAKFMEEFHKSKRQVPIIAMSSGESATAREEDNAVSAMLCLGAVTYLKYPFTPREIIAATQEVVNSVGAA